MPTIIRRSSTILEARREILQTIHWQVRSSLWSPPTDIYETDEQYVIRVEIAGMREADFEIIVEDNILTIGGNRSNATERCAYHQMEIQFGRFEIGVELPAPVDVERASAHYEDGFLTIRLPKVGVQNETKVET
jgi:HSP20 family protein